jgi:glycosyltransferase involved in cell wall biosynthesis
MRDILRECTVPEQDWPADLLDGGAYHAAGIHFLQPVLSQAKSVIVSTDVAAKMIQEIGVGVPILVLPLAYPKCESIVGRPSRPVVVSVGWVDPSKRPLDVLRAVAATKADLIFVGEASDANIKEVLAEASLLGMNSRVNFTGRLSDDEYDKTLRSATAAIQLRVGGGRGEQSAAVTDALARGIPVISDVGASQALSVSAIGAILQPLLEDEAAWVVASAEATKKAQSWTFADVGNALALWVDRSHQLGAATIHQAIPLG